MSFQLPEYRHPDFSQDPFISASDANIKLVEKEAVAPDNYHALSIFPEYFKINGNWVLVSESRMDCVPVLM